MRRNKTIKFVKSLKFLLACSKGIGVQYYSVNGGKRFTHQEALKVISSHIKRLKNE